MKIILPIALIIFSGVANMSGPAFVESNNTPYVTEFDSADAGKTANYMLRWVSKRGEPGPWSQTVSGTITN